MTYYFVMVALIIGSYFLGNVNFSIIISKFKNRDVRKVGSGNPGTMNMLRSFGIRLGALTLILDALKGAIPALLGWWLLGKDTPGISEAFAFGGDKIGLYIGGLSAVIGHCFPVIYKFKGGKGVATTIGVVLVAQPIVTLISIFVAFLFLITIKVGALASFIAIGCPLAYVATISFIDGSIAEAVLAIVIGLLVIVMHHANIKRIFRGEEKPVVLFGKNKTATKMMEEEKHQVSEKNE